MRPLLLYIHGFNSSPQSQKAEEIRDYIAAQSLPIEFISPALPNYPGESWRLLEQELVAQQRRQRKKIALIGSSLGGFFATALAERMRLKAVLVNPVVRPSELAGHFLGGGHNPYSGEDFYLHQGHIDEMRLLESKSLSAPSNFLLMAQKGDETLDYRQAVEYYHQSPKIIEDGGDHRFQGFKTHLPEIMKFLELPG
jgi:predicted esterase YcpF (UPF0227 family)